MIDARPWLRRGGALLVAVLVAGCGSQAPPERSGPPEGILRISTNAGTVTISVEIAETRVAKSRGLMGRTSLPEDAGMVFLEDRPTTSGFWMKDTLIPLSIAFWDDDGRIVRIFDMEPCREDPCQVYEPGAAWVGAVEVNQGFFDEHAVSVGNRVSLLRVGPVGASSA